MPTNVRGGHESTDATLLPTLHVPADAELRDGRSRVFIEALEPVVDAGAHAVKRVLGDTVRIRVDLIADGHDLIAGEVLVRRPRTPALREPHSASPAPEEAVPLERLLDDRFSASLTLSELGRWHYTVQAWIDRFASWQRGFQRKLAAGQSLELELLVGAALVAAAAQRASGHDASALAAVVRLLESTSEPTSTRTRAALEPELARLMARHPDRSHASRHSPWLPIWVDRERARFSAWYEMFPRSTGRDGQHGSFETSRALLPYVAEMGFDILYLPPIHPIGRSFRKGKNNSPAATESDVGSPWAIGSAEGGHKSVHSALGTLEDFARFADTAAQHGLELALDIALQVTPDHPYVREHPEWFKRRPDGSIQYAENPPKQYQDIYPFDFECEAWWSLWLELKSIFDFWVAQGVRVFRVDNPHTKSLAFWKWCIAELTAEHADLIFLAEAFTRPKLMYLLAKVGFTQSYTYFTWRNTAEELRAYLEELNAAPTSEFLRPNFWPNTPDILPEHLQHAGRPAFALRLVLAATLSSNYGIYGPAFELGDNLPRAGVEEYQDNEKYELKRWNRSDPASLQPLISRINAIRRSNSALQQPQVRFHETDNPLLLCFSRHSELGDNSVLVVVNMDVHNVQSGWVELDVRELVPAPPARQHDLQLHDLLSDARYYSEGRRLFVRLDPATAPAHIFRLRRRARTENDFDYFV
ncbi:MAG: alpha-1,4-glucan--maltose-1-phosphate maltosyltransferase [Deltaproteobacteria bacterium]